MSSGILAASGDPGDERVAAARLGAVLSANQDDADLGIQEGPAALIYSSTTVSLLTKESTSSYDLAEVTQIGSPTRRPCSCISANIPSWSSSGKTGQRRVPYCSPPA